MSLSLDGTQALGPRRGVGSLWKLKAQESRKYFDSCPWCTDASWKLVPGASPHSSPPPFQQPINHRVLNTVWRTLFTPPLSGAPCQAEVCSKLSREKREWAPGRGAHYLSAKHRKSGTGPQHAQTGWTSSAASVFWPRRAPYLAAPPQKWGR